MANPFPFVANTVLTAAQLNGIGELSSFTPTISGVTLGNGTKTGVYIQVNKLVWFRVRCVFGSTTSITGAVDLTLPVAPTGYATGNGMNLQTVYNDSSAGTFFVGTNINIGGTTARCYANLASGTYTSYTDLSASVPMTWATSDTLEIFGTYEAA